jgi:hypothetical protein
MYSILIHTGKGGELNQGEGERGNSLQSWVENNHGIKKKIWNGHGYRQSH